MAPRGVLAAALLYCVARSAVAQTASFTLSSSNVNATEGDSGVTIVLQRAVANASSELNVTYATQSATAEATRECAHISIVSWSPPHMDSTHIGIQITVSQRSSHCHTLTEIVFA